MKRRVNFLSIPIDRLTMDETLDQIDEAISAGRQIRHTAINAGKVVLMQKDKELFQSVVSSELINADGKAVVWASHLLGDALPERVAGIDLMDRIVDLAEKKGYTIFFFGAKEEIVNKVVNYYINKYSGAILAGYRNGYFKKDQQSEIAKAINKSGADILFVAISSPIKENFLYRYREELKDIGLIMGVGGSFDVISGKIKRAPHWMQENGLEWLFRLVQEPKKMWRRYLIGNAEFVYLVLRDYFKK